MFRVSVVAMLMCVTLIVSRALPQEAGTKSPLNGSETWDVSRLKDGWEILKTTFDRNSRTLKIHLKPLPDEILEQLRIRGDCDAKCFDADGEQLAIAEIAWAQGEGENEILKVKLSDIEKALKRQGAKKEQIRKIKLTD